MTKKIKFMYEIIIIAFVFSLSIIGIHYLITEILNYKNFDSIVVLIPVFLISLPSVVYGYYLGLLRKFKSHSDIKKLTLKDKFTGLMCICVNIIIIILPILIGLYLILIKKNYTNGIIFFVIGAIISIPLTLKLYRYLIWLKPRKPEL